MASLPNSSVLPRLPQKTSNRHERASLPLLRLWGDHPDLQAVSAESTYTYIVYYTRYSPFLQYRQSILLKILPCDHFIQLISPSTTRRPLSGQSVTKASTPMSQSRFISALASTVQTCTASPASWQRAI